jgi:hypothetical protein
MLQFLLSPLHRLSAVIDALFAPDAYADGLDLRF